MGVATQQPGVVTARDREFTTLRGALKGSLLTPLSLSCSGIPISANIGEEIVNHQRCTICNAPRLTAAVTGRGLARFGSDVKRCGVTNRYDMSYRRSVKSLLSVGAELMPLARYCDLERNPPRCVPATLGSTRAAP